MKLLVGLGNPGPSYLLNRHNVGFILLDMICNDYALPPFKAKGKAMMSEGMIKGTKCILLKPMNFMNNSGPSVSQVANFYKIPLNDVIKQKYTILKATHLLFIIFKTIISIL